MGKIRRGVGRRRRVGTARAGIAALIRIAAGITPRSVWGRVLVPPAPIARRGVAAVAGGRGALIAAAAETVAPALMIALMTALRASLLGVSLDAERRQGGEGGEGGDDPSFHVGPPFRRRERP
jgi:hypothetical protein